MEIENHRDRRWRRRSRGKCAGAGTRVSNRFPGRKKRGGRIDERNGIFSFFFSFFFSSRLRKPRGSRFPRGSDTLVRKSAAGPSIRQPHREMRRAFRKISPREPRDSAISRRARILSTRLRFLRQESQEGLDREERPALAGSANVARARVEIRPPRITPNSIYSTRRRREESCKGGERR